MWLANLSLLWRTISDKLPKSTLRRTSSLEMWSRHDIPRILRRHLWWKTSSFCRMLNVLFEVSQACQAYYKVIFCMFTFKHPEQLNETNTTDSTVHVLYSTSVVDWTIGASALFLATWQVRWMKQNYSRTTGIAWLRVVTLLEGEACSLLCLQKIMSVLISSPWIAEKCQPQPTYKRESFTYCCAHLVDGWLHCCQSAGTLTCK